MYDLVDGIGGYAGFDGRGGDIEDFAAKAARFPHAFLLLLVEDRDIVPAEEAISRVAIRCIIRVLDGLGYCSPG